MESNPHHLVMGELTDFITGRTIADTHDERYHQKLARQLVQTLGFAKEKIEQKKEVVIRTGDQAAKVVVDFLVKGEDRVDMMIKYAPGSLVTRRLSNLALSRIILPYYIPVVVTTNGEDAEVISGMTGKVIGQGLDAVPGPGDTLMTQLSGPQVPVPPELFDKASRIAFACEVDGACPCDTGICHIDP